MEYWRYPKPDMEENNNEERKYKVLLTGTELGIYDWVTMFLSTVDNRGTLDSSFISAAQDNITFVTNLPKYDKVMQNFSSRLNISNTLYKLEVSHISERYDIICFVANCCHPEYMAKDIMSLMHIKEYLKDLRKKGIVIPLLFWFCNKMNPTLEPELASSFSFKSGTDKVPDEFTVFSASRVGSIRKEADIYISDKPFVQQVFTIDDMRTTLACYTQLLPFADACNTLYGHGQEAVTSVTYTTT